MPAGRSFARNLGYAYLILFGAGLLIFGGLELYKRFGPAYVVVESVPFGLEGESKIPLGDSPDFEGQLEQLPFATRDEFRRAGDLAEAGSSVQAVEVFDALSITYPELDAAQFGAMNALFDMEELPEARRTRLETLAEKLKAKYQGSMASFIESRRSFEAGSSANALEFARIAAEGAPACFQFRLWYGRLLFENGHYSLSAEEARAAVSLSMGNSVKAYSLLANAFHNLGGLDSCGSIVEYALSKFSLEPSLLLLQGYLAEYRGKFDSAERSYRRILALWPEFSEAEEAIVTLGEKAPPGNGIGVSGTPAELARIACEILEPLVAEYPDNLPLREALGRAYLKGRRFEQAKTQFEEIRSKDPEYPDIQLRLQEASVIEYKADNSEELADNLNRALDSLRGAGPATSHDFSSQLGHYLVRYGASIREFFSKYAVSNFKQIAKGAWQEHFYDGTYSHVYTVLFNDKNQFYGVHVFVEDTSGYKQIVGRVPEIYTKLALRNSRISGIGSATGETECGTSVIEATVWDSQDNFEILSRNVKEPNEIRMIRLDKNSVPLGLRLCDYLQYLNAY